MEVTVKIFGELYRYLPTGRDQATIVLDRDARLSDLIKQLGVPDHAIWVITVNNQRVPPEHPLSSGDVIAIFAPVAGG